MATSRVTDYDFILRRFLQDIGRMSDAVSSVVLFGSMARGDVIPGQSDVMDAYVFLKPEIFDDREQFLAGLEIMAEACEKIAEKAPGPYHPFFYWNELDCVPATFNLDITVHSKVVFGSDFRGRILSTPASRRVAQTAFFEVRRLGAPLMFLLHKTELSEQDCRLMFELLVTIKRDMPMLALMVLDIWVVQKESIVVLKQTLPDLNADILDRIIDLQRDESATENPRLLQDMFREAMIFIEDLNDQLIAGIQTKPQSSTHGANK